MKGKGTDGFIHIADWYATFCKLVGIDSSDSGEGKFPMNGLDVWPTITGENSTTLHDEIVLFVIVIQLFVSPLYLILACHGSEVGIVSS